MERTTREQLVMQRARGLRVIAIAMAASLVMYVGLAWYLVAYLVREPILELSAGIRATIGISGLAIIFIAHIGERLVRGARFRIREA